MGRNVNGMIEGLSLGAMEGGAVGRLVKIVLAKKEIFHIKLRT